MNKKSHEVVEEERSAQKKNRKISGDESKSTNGQKLRALKNPSHVKNTGCFHVEQKRRHGFHALRSVRTCERHE